MRIKIHRIFTWSLKLQSVTLTASTKGKLNGEDRLKATLENQMFFRISKLPEFEGQPDKIAQVVKMVSTSNNDQVSGAVPSVRSR